MKATIKDSSAHPQRNAKNMGGEKEVIHTRRVVADLGGERLATIIEARFYMGRSQSASQVHCSLWVTAGAYPVSGYGKASGYGYHKESAALQAAISSAGITLLGDGSGDYPDIQDASPVSICGCGSSSMDSALLAIARLACPDAAKPTII